jgi:hypothetical protein
MQEQFRKVSQHVPIGIALIGELMLEHQSPGPHWENDISRYF